MGSAQSIGDDARLLYDAARRGDTAEVARLARLGAGLEWRDSKGRTPLMAATALSKRAVVEQARAHGRRSAGCCACCALRALENASNEGALRRPWGESGAHDMAPLTPLRPAAAHAGRGRARRGQHA